MVASSVDDNNNKQYGKRNMRITLRGTQGKIMRSKHFCVDFRMEFAFKVLEAP